MTNHGGGCQPSSTGWQTGPKANLIRLQCSWAEIQIQQRSQRSSRTEPCVVTRDTVPIVYFGLLSSQSHSKPNTYLVIMAAKRGLNRVTQFNMIIHKTQYQCFVKHTRAYTRHWSPIDWAWWGTSSTYWGTTGHVYISSSTDFSVILFNLFTFVSKDSIC